MHIISKQVFWVFLVIQLQNNVLSFSSFRERLKRDNNERKQKTCPDILSTDTFKVSCRSANGILTENCIKATDGTVASFKCAQFYEISSRNNVNLCQDGAWNDELPKCIPVCGKKSVRATPLIIGGTNTTKGDFPWQAALYNKDNILICGGSLISQNLIISAAHCVTNNRGVALPKENYEIAVGKYYRKRDDSRDKNEAQFSTLKEIIIPLRYKGNLQNYAADIALLVTTKKFVLSPIVQPVCVDWGHNFESDFQNPQKSGFGYVTGWGFTKEYKEPSEVLQEIKVPPVAFDTCFANIPEDFEQYLTDDKMCAGFYDKNTSICNGDTGGGLVFKFDGRYYLAGVASLSPQAPSLTGGCDSQHVALYTKLYSFTAFIYPKFSLYD